MHYSKLAALALCIYSGVLLTNTARARAENSAGKISVQRYIAGGILGTTIGLGFGHSVQGRWYRDYGWLFTAGGIITGLGAIWSDNCGVGVSGKNGNDKMHLLENENYDECIAADKRQRRKWIIAFFTTKAIETIAVWWPRNVSFAPTSDDTAAKSADMHLIPITQDKYLLGGLLGTIVGFGSGHAVQGRWRHDGWPYTLTQVGGAGLAVYSSLCMRYSSAGPDILDAEPKPDYPLCALAGMGTTLLGIATLIVARIVEIASVWGPNSDHYRIVTSNQPSPLSIMPLLDIKQAGVQVVWALK